MVKFKPMIIFLTAKKFLKIWKKLNPNKKIQNKIKEKIKVKRKIN